MRAGGCTVQQALSPEAAVVVKQAVSLARRRGNAQVTPLHVASAMLHQHQAPPAAAAGLLRAACLQSHSHPLQCKALELCFNVALNRLPASASPLLGGHGHVYYPPSLSNALVAAFKRAQAHQRRGGSVDATQTQQPAVLAVKIELEQLVISILDDPSVSRVMREAGFSSTQVKATVEQAVVSSIEASNSNSASTNTAAAAAAAPQNPNPSAAASAAPPEETKPTGNGKLLLLPPPPLDQARDDDVAVILDCLASSRSKRRVMVVAECAAAAEAPTRAAVEKIRRGEAVALALRGARVVSLSVSRFRDLPRDEAERRLVELRRAVKAGGGGGVVLVVEDLGWAAEFWAGRASRWPTTTTSSCCGYYCAVEHAVAEVRALTCRGGGGVWLVGYGTYQSYMRCRAGQPSLETLWGLQTLAVPAGSLALSLNFLGAGGDSSATAMAMNHHSISSMMAKCDDDRSGNGSAPRCLSLLDAGGSGHLSTAVSGFCADDCDPAVKSSIPPWLLHCQEPSQCNKKSSTCGGSPSHHHRTTAALNISTVVSPSSSSVSSYEQQHYIYNLHKPYQPWLVVADADDAHEAKHHHPCHQAAARCGGAAVVQLHDVVDDEDVKLLSAIKVKSQQSHDSSASNGGPAVECRRRRSRFKELSAENLKVLCSALEKAVPWQAEIVPEIASTVLQCRSGMARRPAPAPAAQAACAAKEDTWMLFHGGDAEGKTRVARELARLVFGSRDSLVSIGGGGTTASSPAPSDGGSSEQQRKRPRRLTEASNDHGDCRESLSLYEAVRDNPHRVILVEDGGWRRCQSDILEAIQSGMVRSHAGDGGDDAALGDAIVVLSCESFDAWSTTSSPFLTTTKKAKTEESEGEPKEEESAGDHRRHKEAIAAAAAPSPSSSPCFDLNMDVEDDDDSESCFFADASLLKAVDRTFFFRRHDESSD